MHRFVCILVGHAQLLNTQFGDDTTIFRLHIWAVTLCCVQKWMEINRVPMGLPWSLFGCRSIGNTTPSAARLLDISQEEKLARCQCDLWYSRGSRRDAVVFVDLKHGLLSWVGIIDPFYRMLQLHVFNPNKLQYPRTFSEQPLHCNCMHVFAPQFELQYSGVTVYHHSGVLFPAIT